MLVQIKRTNDAFVYTYPKNHIKGLIRRLYGKIFSLLYPFYATWSWNHFGFDISNSQEVKDADIIILHWINAFTLSISSIEKILKSGKTVYWFMHDMWPITGGCHHALLCTKFESQCERCEMAHGHKGSNKKRDLSYWQFHEKLNRLAPYYNLKFITPSQWLAEKVKRSAIFHNHKIFVVRNVLNTEIFKPRNKEEARKRLGLPLNKKLILFGADNISSPYKGWSILKKAISYPINNTEAVVYGITPAGIELEIGMKLHVMGHISNTSTLIDLYSACDVFVSTSLAENYPNVLIEAMSCGLKCIGTNVGGIPEIISSQYGHIVNINNTEELRNSIIKLLSDNLLNNSLAARENIEKNNSYSQGLVKFFNLEIDK